jgi:hypothetical protein
VELESSGFVFDGGCGLAWGLDFGSWANKGIREQTAKKKRTIHVQPVLPKLFKFPPYHTWRRLRPSDSTFDRLGMAKARRSFGVEANLVVMYVFCTP